VARNLKDKLDPILKNLLRKILVARNSLVGINGQEEIAQGVRFQKPDLHEIEQGCDEDRTEMHGVPLLKT